MQIVYNKNDGMIMSVLEDWQNISVYYHHYPEEFKDNLDSITIDEVPQNLVEYKVVDKKLTLISKEELQDMQIYGRILTEEERQLEKLKPSQEEIQKAEQTIEILTLIQEVM